MNALRIGSLCTGYGGLDVAVQAVIGGELAWVADPDPGAAAILAHHHPDVPNLGNITTVRWQDIAQVDILCAGFPCQDISYAGRGEGIQEGNRSGLWHTIADALGVLRPRLIVLENVAAIIARRPGLDVVLADLARLGLDAEWTCVRASDIGAPHQRNRWFLSAWPADAEGSRLQGPRLRGLAAGCGRAPADADRVGDERNRPSGQPAERHATGAGGAAADTNSDALRQQPVTEPRGSGAAFAEFAGVEWGAYGAAVKRWEPIIGRRAPVPRLPTGRGGADQLSPVFVEWMMGLPAGHVTAVPGLSRNAQLKALGNGVVPQQATAALVHLMERRAAA